MSDSPNIDSAIRSKFERLLRDDHLDPSKATLPAETPPLHSGWEMDDHIFLFEYEGRKRVIVSQATDGSPQSIADLRTFLDEYQLAIKSTEAFVEAAKDAEWTSPPGD
jgi:hypothetical protein